MNRDNILQKEESFMLIAFFVGLVILALYLFLAFKIMQEERIQNILYYKMPEWLKLLIIGILLVCSYLFVLDILNLESNGFMGLIVVTIGMFLGLMFRKPKNQ